MLKMMEILAVFNQKRCFMLFYIGSIPPIPTYQSEGSCCTGAFLFGGQAVRGQGHRPYRADLREPLSA